MFLEDADAGRLSKTMAATVERPLAESDLGRQHFVLPEDLSDLPDELPTDSSDDESPEVINY